MDIDLTCQFTTRKPLTIFRYELWPNVPKPCPENADMEELQKSAVGIIETATLPCLLSFVRKIAGNIY
jgi:hypothetical protein